MIVSASYDDALLPYEFTDIYFCAKLLHRTVLGTNDGNFIRLCEISLLDQLGICKGLAYVGDTHTRGQKMGEHVFKI